MGIREPRQNPSVYVKRVREEARAYELTERSEGVRPARKRRRSLGRWTQSRVEKAKYIDQAGPQRSEAVLRLATD